MKILILGATGPTGQCLVTQALDAGHDVTAAVRTPSKMTTTHDNLKVVEAHIFSASSLQDHMTEQDAVFSCLGVAPEGWLQECTFYTDYIKPVMTAINVAKVRRLLVVTSWGTTDEKGPFMLDWFYKPLLLKKILRNMGEMETYIQDECQSDISYTVIKPPILGGSEVTDKEIKAEVGRHSIAGSGYSVLNRGDVARFMLSCLDDNDDGAWDNKIVAIGH